MYWDMGPYEWIVVIGAILSVFCAYGIGANDVANAFATSVGAKVLTVKQAVIIASIFEFGGAVLLGGHVSTTIRKGIADIDCFKEDPAVLMYGMMGVILSTGIWLLVATKYELPVSTTHSCVGAVVGFTWAIKGTDCIQWAESSSSFPYTKGISAIVISWFLSPLLSGIFSGIIFFVTRWSTLRASNALDRSKIAIPTILFLTVLINAFFIIFKGGKGLGWNKIGAGTAALVAFIIALVVTGVGTPMLFNYWQSTVVDSNADETSSDDEEKPKVKDLEANNTEDKKGKFELAVLEDMDDCSVSTSTGTGQSPTASPKSSEKGSLKNWNVDVHKVVGNDEIVKSIHETAEEFDPRVEARFSCLQVLTATCDSFAHGANDVANAVGPFFAIWAIYQEGATSKKVDVGDNAFWILALGGLGIVLGLATMGATIIQAIGVKLAKITPSRGFSIELGAALVVLIGSTQGWPLSTTHCQVGATVGVGLLEGRASEAINWKLFGRICVGWIVTLVTAGFLSAAIAAQALYAPTVVDLGMPLNGTAH
jgi:sodium-dependent phosphate transporter